MFKQAVDTHQAVKTKARPLAQQLFPSSSPLSPQNTFKANPYQRNTQHPISNPLSDSSGNAQKPCYGVKRTASGLAKALPSTDRFEDADLYRQNSQKDPIVINDDSPVKITGPKSTPGVYLDENDFDSDVDLDVEDLATRTTISYPGLPQAKGYDAERVQYPELTNLGNNASHNGTWTSGDGKGKQATSTTTQQSFQPPSSFPLPWSSSPVEHRQSPLKRATLQQHAFSAPVNTTSGHSASDDVDDIPRPHKRRTIPWLGDDHNSRIEDRPNLNLDRFKADAPSRSSVSNAPLKRENASSARYTPASRKSDSLIWNTTASALKEQQKSLRQAKKALFRTNEATEEGLKQAKEKKKKNNVSRIFLSDEQQQVLTLVVDQGKSVFFTGSAGTGKSVLLREIIAALRRKYLREPDRVAVTASTGLAACNIGGVTLHSFAGIGLGKEAAPDLVKKIKKNQKAKHRWMRTRVLIVDEVSMVDGDLFDKLETVARTIRNNGRPFGGIQLIITGDFFQLPPVPDSGRAAKFAFDAGTWNTSIDFTIGLHKVFRQKDPTFAGMLNEMREGRLSQNSIDTFRKLERDLAFGDEITATELFPTRAEVDRANRTRMQDLRGDHVIYDAKDGGAITDKTARDRLLQNCMAPEVIYLKKHAQVMLIKNMDETLVNGSLGVVLGFMSEDSFADYQQREDQLTATQEWGTQADPSVSEARLAGKYDLKAGTAQRYPVVRFAIADGTTRDMLCHRELWKVELPDGEVQASRSQVPLILAWALSIHKAQGQTLERVKVDLGKVFEKGQAYVALSRATSMDGLQVKNFDPRKVLAHDRVRQFYASLSRAEHAGVATGKQDAKK